jgi:hypothetical protein
MKYVGEIMSIFVVSPINLISEGLVLLLETYGYKAYADAEAKPAIALVDLINAEGPYPKPYAVPTVALINSDQSKAQALLALGYFACVDANQKSNTLVQIVKSALANQTTLMA